MKARPLLIATAVLSSIAGGIVVYLLLSVPNDLRADALLDEARKDIAAGQPARARTALARVVQQYPRTDAAAAATIALISISEKDHENVAQSIGLLRRQNEQQTALIASLQKDVAQLRKPPPPVVTVTAPPPKPAPAKKPVTIKKTKRRK